MKFVTFTGQNENGSKYLSPHAGALLGDVSQILDLTVTLDLFPQ